MHPCPPPPPLSLSLSLTHTHTQKHTHLPRELIQPALILNQKHGSLGGLETGSVGLYALSQVDQQLLKPLHELCLVTARWERVGSGNAYV
jgi:hypothetical protein